MKKKKVTNFNILKKLIFFIIFSLIMYLISYFFIFDRNIEYETYYDKIGNFLFTAFTVNIILLSPLILISPRKISFESLPEFIQNYLYSASLLIIINLIAIFVVVNFYEPKIKIYFFAKPNSQYILNDKKIVIKKYGELKATPKDYFMLDGKKYQGEGIYIISQKKCIRYNEYIIEEDEAKSKSFQKEYYTYSNKDYMLTGKVIKLYNTIDAGVNVNIKRNFTLYNSSYLDLFKVFECR